MMEFIKDYQRKPWPKLEIRPLQRRQIVWLVLFLILFMAIGWAIYLNPQTRVKYFAMMGLVVPIAFFLKSRYTALIGILALQVVLAFVFMGNQNYALVFVAGIAGAIIAFESPIMMYMLLIVAVWFDKSLFSIGHPLRTELILGAGLMMGWIYRLATGRRERTETLHFVECIPALLLFGWIILGFLFWSPERFPAGWLNLKVLIAGVFLFLITPLLLRSEKEVELAVWAWIGMGLIAGVMTVYAVHSGYTGGSSSSTAGSSASLLVSYKNVTATYMTYSFFLTLAAYHWFRDVWKRAGMALLLLFDLAVIVYLQSRMAVLGLMVALLLYWILETFWNLRRRNARRTLLRLFVLFAVMALAVLGGLYLDVDQSIGYYGELIEQPTQSGSIQFRLMVIRIVQNVTEAERHFFRGNGIGSFYVLAPQYGFPFSNYEEDTVQFHTHSLVLDIFFHYGIIGLLMFIVLALTSFIRVWRAYMGATDEKFRYLYQGLVLALVATYVHALFDYALCAIVEWWIFIGLVAAAVNVGKNRGLA